MDKGKFFDQINRLSSAFQWKITDAAIEFWFKDLDPRGYSDEVFKAAVSRIIYAGGTRFPSLGDLDKACREIRCVRIEKEARESKGPADRDAKFFFHGKEYKSPVAKDSMSLIRKVALGVVAPRDLPGRMRELAEKHPKANFNERAGDLDKHFEKLDEMD